MLGDFVQIFADDDPRRSETTLLIAAMLTLGIPAAADEFCHVTCQRQHGGLVWRTIWTLREASTDGRFKARHMQRVWNDGQWLLSNPAHPLAIIRGGLTYPAAFRYTPKFTSAEIARIETPDTWFEGSVINLVMILRDLPTTLAAARELTWFAHDKAAAAPRCMSDSERSRLLRYVEGDDERRGQIRVDA